ncbi:MAG: type II 3-dehydroquinate dehydratase [Ignavibacteriaceae bacterium]|jgi:3-dehydroquinate dehydratase-2
MKILIINGPNLNLLGERPNEFYGSYTLNDLEKNIKQEFPQHNFEFFQSNHEGELIEKIQGASRGFNGLIINPGGYSHTSIAIRDALELVTIPKIEVHLSNLAKRENFRHTMLTASNCDGYISGFGENSYMAAIYLIEKKLISKK